MIQGLYTADSPLRDGVNSHRTLTGSWQSKTFRTFLFFMVQRPSSKSEPGIYAQSHNPQLTCRRYVSCDLLPSRKISAQRQELGKHLHAVLNETTVFTLSELLAYSSFKQCMPLSSAPTKGEHQNGLEHNIKACVCSPTLCLVTQILQTP